MSAHGAQIVQQWQQHERHVTPAAHHTLEIGWQLHHRAHQRIETLDQMALLGKVLDEVLEHLAHFFGQERGSIHLGNA